MLRLRRHATVLVVLLAATALAACGSAGNRSAVLTGPSQSAGPDTTGTPAATTTPSATPQPSPTATATPTPTPAGPSVQPTPYYVPPSDANGPADVAAYLYRSSAGVACGATQHHYDSCPVTSRLAQRLDGNPTPGGEPLCRCQNSWQSSQVTPIQSADPSVGLVHVVLVFGPAATVKLDVTVRRTAAGWLADDTTCTSGGSQTSIYSAAPPPCPG